MRYIIHGAGGVGCTIGGRLFRHGHDVALICRGEHLAAIRRDGLTLKIPGEVMRLPIPAVGHPRELRYGPGDVVIVAMKTQDTAAALDDLRAAGAGERTPVICAQNGVENERQAFRRFSNVYGLVTRLPAVFVQPGVVLNHATPVGGVLDLGRYPEGVDHLVMMVVRDLASAGFRARAEERVMRWKYAKLIRNLNNGLTAICGADLQAPEFSKALADEAYACYEAAGIDYATDEEERGRRADGGYHLEAIDGEARAGNSTLQSLQRGLSTVETDYLNGEIALLGRMHGVPTPHNVVVQRVTAAFAREGRRPGEMSIEDLSELVRQEAGDTTSSRAGALAT